MWSPQTSWGASSLLFREGEYPNAHSLTPPQQGHWHISSQPASTGNLGCPLSFCSESGVGPQCLLLCVCVCVSVSFGWSRAVIFQKCSTVLCFPFSIFWLKKTVFLSLIFWSVLSVSGLLSPPALVWEIWGTKKNSRIYYFIIFLVLTSLAGVSSLHLSESVCVCMIY